jgi:hypothetical protein
MDFADQVHGMQGVDLARTGGATALIHTANCTLLTQDDGAAGEGFVVLRMPNQDAWNISDSISKLHHQPPV